MSRPTRPSRYWIVAALQGVVGVLREFAHAFRAPAPQEWAAAARGCGLVQAGESTWTTADDVASTLLVEFRAWNAADDSGEVNMKGTYVTIDSPDIVALTLSPETSATARAKKRGAREIETGDEDFDADFFVTGPATVARAVLDGETRRLLSSLRVEVELEMASGTLKGRVPLFSTAARPGPPDPLLPRALPLMLAAAQRLARPAEIPTRLARNAQSDPQSAVRLHNLMSLVRDYPDDAILRGALRAGCDDASDAVRVRAAIALGEDGRPTLLDVAKCGYAEDGPMARAVAALGDRISTPDLQAVLSHALRTRRVEAARSCLHAFGRRADPQGIKALARVLTVEKGELAVAAAQALAETGEEAAQPLLLGALAHDRPSLHAACAEALGRVGTAGAILPLKDLEKRSRDDATRRAARQAVAAIQSRLPGASAGQLSLAAADAGALSLAEDETGRLSLDDDRKP